MFLLFNFEPPKWDEGTMRVFGSDATGWSDVDARYTMANIPAEHVPALQEVVQSIIALGESWWATQVHAFKGSYVPDGAKEAVPCIDLRAEVRSITPEEAAAGAVNPELPYRIASFASDKYPQLRLTSPGALAFFDYFTTPHA